MFRFRSSDGASRKKESPNESFVRYTDERNAYALFIRNGNAGETFFGDDDVVEQLDAHDLAALYQLLRDLDVGVARFQGS